MKTEAEPKVVEKIAASSDGYSFDPRSVATAQSGRGGNFALGYTGGHGRNRRGAMAH